MASPRNDERYYVRRSDLGARAIKILFTIFVDAIFTTLFERLFTNVFDVIGAKCANDCVCRAGNAD